MPDKPKPEAKEVWGSVTESVQQAMLRLREAVNKRLRAAQEPVCILDGERGLWLLVHKYFPTAFFVLDIFHVLEHLAQAAHCFYEEKTPEAGTFVTKRLKMLLTGQIGRLIGGLKQLVSKRKLSKSQRCRAHQGHVLPGTKQGASAIRRVWRKAIRSEAESSRGLAAIS